MISIGVMALLYWQLTAWQDRQPKDDGFGVYRGACLSKFYREHTASLDDIFNYGIKYLCEANQDYKCEIGLEAKVGSDIRVICLFDEETDKIKNFRIYPTSF